MTYKGYIGQVELDDENHIFSGTVINVRDVITFHGESVQELESELQASVNDYLAWCMEDGGGPSGIAGL